MYHFSLWRITEDPAMFSVITSSKPAEHYQEGRRRDHFLEGFSDKSNDQLKSDPSVSPSLSKYYSVNLNNGNNVLFSEIKAKYYWTVQINFLRHQYCAFQLGV